MKVENERLNLMCQRLSVKELPSSVRLKVRHFHGEESQWEIGDIRETYLAISNGVKKVKYATEASIVDRKTDREICSSVSVCSPKDTPNRKRGWQIAVRRVVKLYKEEYADVQA
jgi:hypothetical protein